MRVLIYFGVCIQLTFLTISCRTEIKDSKQIVSKYLNGQTKIKKVYVDNFSGDYLEYYENGQPKFIGKFTKDNYSGIRMSYYPNGQVEFIDSIKIANCPPDSCFCDGSVTHFDTRGHVDEFYEVQDAIKNGYSFKIFESGLKREVYFVDGKIEGIVKTYDKKGKLIHERTFKHSILEGPTTEFNDNNIIYGQYLNGKETGEWVHKDSMGKIFEIDTYENGKRVAVRAE